MTRIILLKFPHRNNKPNPFADLTSMNRCTPERQDPHLWLLNEPLGLSYRQISLHSHVPISTIQHLAKGKFPSQRNYYRLRELIIQCRDAYVLDDPRLPYLVHHKRRTLRLINDVLQLPRETGHIKQSDHIRIYLTSLTESTPRHQVIAHARKLGWPWSVVQKASQRLPIAKTHLKKQYYWQFTPIDSPPASSV